MKRYLHFYGSRTRTSGEHGYQIIEVESCALFNKLTITLIVFSQKSLLGADLISDLYWCTLYSPHSSSSELSPQSSTLLQTWSVRRHTWSFLQRNGLVGGQGSFAGDEKTRKVNGYVFQNKKKQLHAILYKKTVKSSLLENRIVVVYKICISCLQRKALWVTLSTHHTCLCPRQSYLHNRPCHHTPTCGVCIRCCCKWTHRPGRRKHLQLHTDKSSGLKTL